MKQIIDSHIHLDMVHRHHPQRIQWLRENHCAVVSWSYFSPPESVAQLQENLQRKARTINELFNNGMACNYLAGVHPRSIPPDLKPEAIDSLLTPFMEDPRCLGIGEIGLETGEAREEEIFIAQLELGRRLSAQGKIIGIHTPRSNKVALTENTLQHLTPFSELADSIVIDHCTAETIRAVLEAGFWAGVTLSPEKVSWEEMRRIVSLCPNHWDRIMCNSDSGYRFYEDIAQLSRREELDRDLRTKFFRENARRFFYGQDTKL